MKTITLPFKIAMFLFMVCCPILMNGQTTITSWVGNSWGNTASDPNWVQNDVRGMYVVPDGTIYTASNWDEGTHECGIYSTNGTFMDALDDTHAKTWYAVTVGNNYVFVGYDKGFQRYTYNGSNKDGAYIQVSSSSIDDAPVKGLAIDPVANELYVNNWLDKKIQVFNTATLALKRSWSFTNNGAKIGVGQMAWDGINLWAVQNKNIVKMSSTGTVLATITTVGRPDGLWCDKLGSGSSARLLVADGGPDQQIKIFNISGTPTQTGTFGDQYGIVAGIPGQCKSSKLDGPSAVATDAAGNMYIACRGNRSSMTATAPGYHSNGLVLRKFNSAGTMQWQREGLHFVEVATTDPTDETKAYTAYNVYNMDYSKNGNGQEWTHISSTINSNLYPYDARIATPDMMATKADVRTINGIKYLYMQFFENDAFAIYKMDGQIAKPCVFRGDETLSPYFPGAPVVAGYWYWQDNNGDGQMQANEYRQDGNTQITGAPEAGTSGKLWKTTWDTKAVEFITLNSINAYGVPIYAVTPTAVPYTGAIAGNVCRALYLPSTDVMYLAAESSGFGWFNKLIKYTNWSSTRATAWTLNLAGNYQGFDVAGSYVFIGGTDGAPGAVSIYNDATAVLKTTLTAANTGLAQIGWFDFGQCLNVVQRLNGEYTILAEDDGYNKSVLWRWNPGSSNIAVTGVSVSPTSPSLNVGATQQLTATVAPSNATNKIVTWSTSNPAVATVNSAGLVNAIAAGTATITVTTVDGGKTANSAITVIAGGSWTIVDDAATGWTWNGFTNDPCSSCYNGTSHSTNVKSKTATYTFTGTDVEAYCESWSGAGSVSIFIDGVSKGTFNQNVTPYNGGTKFATINGLSNASHTIVFKSTNTNWVGIDYIRFAINPAKSEFEPTENRIASESSILIYPNPATDFVTININNKADNEEVKVQIRDILGKVVYASVLSEASTLQIETTDFAKGIYIIVITHGTEQINNKLIIK